MCRELITIPSGGVQALPPSFLVNQLRDLMARQRREVVPKCSSHPNQELLFCESCDCVFCSLCTADGHINTRDGAEGGSSTESDHTVIPFSIAIKRMSEILLYKAKECTTKVLLWLTREGELFNILIISWTLHTKMSPRKFTNWITEEMPHTTRSVTCLMKFSRLWRRDEKKFSWTSKGRKMIKRKF